MIDEQEFRKHAEAALDTLQRALEKASDRHDFDVDRKEGALTVEFEDPPARFVVSPNSPVQQVWVSALVRSFKLDWSPTARAFVMPDGKTLTALMAEAISTQLGETVTV